jgi:hypothetical protein
VHSRMHLLKTAYLHQLPLVFSTCLLRLKIADTVYLTTYVEGLVQVNVFNPGPCHDGCVLISLSAWSYIRRSARAVAVNACVKKDA